MINKISIDNNEYSIENLTDEGKRLTSHLQAIDVQIKEKNNNKINKLKGFEIQGDGDQAVWADAVIKGNTIIVSAEGVDQIKAVRYGWAINPDVNLYNKEGLPAVPFRTDVP